MEIHSQDRWGVTLRYFTASFVLLFKLGAEAYSSLLICVEDCSITIKDAELYSVILKLKIKSTAGTLQASRFNTCIQQSMSSYELDDIVPVPTCM